ncbi:MAG: InlB B-repeat-containing protein, partial [Erysipelotrichaceae bacterium]|nr:InlB B-repeat-containing protein [Erysipelotrichaceae bacterium]
MKKRRKVKKSVVRLTKVLLAIMMVFTTFTNMPTLVRATDEANAETEVVEPADATTPEPAEPAPEPEQPAEPAPEVVPQPEEQPAEPPVVEETQPSAPAEPSATPEVQPTTAPTTQPSATPEGEENKEETPAPTATADAEKDEQAPETSPSALPEETATPTPETTEEAEKLADELVYDVDFDTQEIMEPTKGYVGEEVEVAAMTLTREGYNFLYWYVLNEDGTETQYKPGDKFVLTEGEDKLVAKWEEAKPEEYNYTVEYVTEDGTVIILEEKTSTETSVTVTANTEIKDVEGNEYVLVDESTSTQEIDLTKTNKVTFNVIAKPVAMMMSPKKDYPEEITGQGMGSGGYSIHKPKQYSIPCNPPAEYGMPPANQHYVVMKESNDHNVVTYIRCDKYSEMVNPPDPEEVTYKVDFIYENGDSIKAIYVNEGKMPAAGDVPDLTNGYWTLKDSAVEVIPSNVAINGPTTFVWHEAEEPTGDKYNVYFYSLVPGYSLDSSAPVDEKWNGMGVIPNSNLENPANIPLGTILAFDNVQFPNGYPNIWVNNKEYYYEPSGTIEGTYHIEWVRMIVDNGANAGANGFNNPIVNSGNTYHVDGITKIVENNLFNISFKIKQPGADYFTIDINDKNSTALVEEGTNESSLKHPNTPPKEFDGDTWEFDGWYYDQECTQKVNFDRDINSDVNYYGRYVRVEKTVNINYIASKGGSVTKKSEQLNAISGQAQGSEAIKSEGYSFKGWYSDDAYNNLVSENNKFIPTKPGERWIDATYYAKFTPEVYTIEYDLVGGTLEKENPTEYTVESEAIKLNNPTKTGYTFIGWTGTGLTEETKEVTIAKGSTGNRKYTANWEANKLSLKVNYIMDDEAGTVLREAYTEPTKYDAAYDLTEQILGTVEYEGKTYVLDSKSGSAVTGTVKENVEITLVYSLDE